MLKKIISLIILALCLGAVVFGAASCEKDDSPAATFTVNDTLSDGEGKCARVVLLGGQSNASGCARDEYLKKNVSAEKYAEYENGYENVYINFFASGTNQSQGFVKASTRQGEAGVWFGPELGLAEKLHLLYPDESIFIIKYAWGATDLRSDWLSPSSLGETGARYKDFISFTDSSIAYLLSKNYDVKIEGMCWMQGESDSLSTKNAKKYERYLKNFIKDIRAHYSDYASDDGIAFIDATIANSPEFWLYCDLLNESKQRVADSSPINALIDTNAAGLICSEEPEDEPDAVHYDSISQIKLGNLFAEELSKFFD